ncbi:MAG: LacI family transcriptional regulator [Candidatus Omnitrophica bacterium]|nr:LacI family transcriptional regulator [Candidatus Omnitrophota bacterium]
MRRRKEPSRNISIVDVARLAKVSISTVSRVINKSASVKEQSRKRVLEAIERLKYRPSVLAQRLATGKSNVIALIIPRYEGIFYSFYALEIIRGVGTLTAALKLDLLLHLTDAYTSFNASGVGGIIFADIIQNRKQLEEVLELGIPCIVINNYVKDLEVSCIAIDNQKASEQVVDYLVGLGHRRIAHITGDLLTQAAQDRLEGYTNGLKKHNIPLREEYILKTDYSRGQARQAAEKMLELKERPTAVFVASDSMALEVMALAQERRVFVPRDLSVVGFDDNPSGLYGPVALTTVRQPLVKMAQDAVKELNVIMNMGVKNVPIRKKYFPCELVIRDSCQPPQQ